MKIKVQGSVLSNILKNISRIAPPLNNALTLKVEKNKFSLIAINEVARCFYSVPTESIEGEGSVCVSIEALKSAIAGRKELTLYEQEGVLKIVSGNFKINLATQEIISYEFEEEENIKTQSWEVTTEQASWLKQAVTNVALTPTAIMENPPLVVKLSSKNAFVCCYSSDHLAFALTKEITGNLELSIPCETFMNVLEVFSKQNFTLSKSDTKLTVSNELCEVSVSLPSQEYLPSQIIIDKVKEVHKAQGTSLSFKKEDLLAYFTNAKALQTKERGSIIFKGNSKKIVLEIRTFAGHCENIFNGNYENVNFGLDQLYFEEAVAKCGEEVSLKWVNDEIQYVYIRTKNSYYLLSTLQNI
jgi:hypothetical protein|nr:MAG TPA: beta clamp protein [Caudoviricetes sp.]